MSQAWIRAALLEAGAKNLRAFGYPDAKPDDVMAVYVYRQFFKSMLEDEKNVGRGYEIETVRKELLAHIEKLDEEFKARKSSQATTSMGD